MAIFRLFRAPVFFAALLFAPLSASAGEFTGTVTGVFSNPVTSGLVVEPGGLSSHDNALTHVFTPIAPNEFRFGDTPTYSEVKFDGAILVDQPSDEDFFLGNLFFINRTSALNTLIFGIDLKISIPGVDDLLVKVDITTTNNLGTEAENADFLTLSGLGIAQSLAAFEGQLVVGSLFARIVGDPQLFLTDIVAVTDGGFVGAAPAVPI